MRSLATTAFFGLLACAMLHPKAARAADPMNFSVCNAYGDTIFLALGWRDAAGGWHSQGWWTVDPGKCNTSSITAPKLYYHWESAAETNCICPPSIGNPQVNGGMMLSETEDAFNFTAADQVQGNANLAWFNPVEFTDNNFSTAVFGGLEKLTIQNDGSDNEVLYLHQQDAINPLP